MEFVPVLLVSKDGLRLEHVANPLPSRLTYLGTSIRNGTSLVLKQIYRLRHASRYLALYEEERASLIKFGGTQKGMIL